MLDEKQATHQAQQHHDFQDFSHHWVHQTSSFTSRHPGGVANDWILDALFRQGFTSLAPRYPEATSENGLVNKSYSANWMISIQLSAGSLIYTDAVPSR